MWRDKNEAVFVLALVRRTDKHCQQELLDKFELLLKTVGYSFRDLTFPCVRHSRHRRTETLLPGRCREQS